MSETSRDEVARRLYERLHEGNKWANAKHADRMVFGDMAGDMLRLLEAFAAERLEEERTARECLCPSCGVSMAWDHGTCHACGAGCGCSFNPTSMADYCDSHRPISRAKLAGGSR